jgi:hypothetical protein
MFEPKCRSKSGKHAFVITNSNADVIDFVCQHCPMQAYAMRWKLNMLFQGAPWSATESWKPEVLEDVHPETPC